MGVVVIVIIKMFLLFLLLLLILSSKRRLISLHCAWFGVSSATNAPSDPGRVQSESQSPSFLRETQARTCTTPWLYTEPSTTRFRLLYSSCRSCYAKRVPSSCHLFACTLLRLVHLLLEEFRISLKSSLSAQSVHSQSHSRNQSPGFFRAGVRVGFPQKTRTPQLTNAVAVPCSSASGNASGVFRTKQKPAAQHMVNTDMTRATPSRSWSWFWESYYLRQAGYVLLVCLLANNST